MSFITFSMCPYRMEGTLSFPPPVPLEVGSAYSNQFGANGYRPDYPAFGTDLFGVWHRNWKPCSWDLEGLITARGNAGGYTASPGPVTGANPVIHDGVDISLETEWNLSGLAPTRIQPDFSRPENVRTMIQWATSGGAGDGFFPEPKVSYVPGIYPVFWDENGVNQTGWYIEVTWNFFARITPYYWRESGQYILTQEFRAESSTRGVPAPGSAPPDNWTLAEFSGFTQDFGGASSHSIDSTQGEVTIQDDTGADPHGGWGSVNLNRLSGNNDYSFGLHIVSNFLPRGNP